MPSPDEPYELTTYASALRTILEIPRLEVESSGATRVVRCLLKPSSHPECAISIVERGTAAEMTLRVPERSVWTLISARRGSPSVDPVTGWVKPAVSAERIEILEPIEDWRVAVADLERTQLPEGSACGIDGMGVDLVLWRPDVERSWETWFGPFDERDPSHRLVRAILDTAVSLARWRQSLMGLQRARAYLG